MRQHSDPNVGQTNQPPVRALLVSKGRGREGVSTRNRCWHRYTFRGGVRPPVKISQLQGGRGSLDAGFSGNLFPINLATLPYANRLLCTVPRLVQVPLNQRTFVCYRLRGNMFYRGCYAIDAPHHPSAGHISTWRNSPKRAGWVAVVPRTIRFSTSSVGNNGSCISCWGACTT